ncbi:insulinase family protein [bacterium]|nr:insulinase family protein [bacterium]
MKKGEKIHGFLIKEVEHIDEIHITFVRAEHIKNGATVFYIHADDKENVFGLCFNTYPTDDTGVPHILEHTVLCGSEKYPVRDPFFSMLRRSCNTFMNAFTSKLWTGYVAASQIEKDFYNILSVYVDAALSPLLTEHSFMQEGHRLEFSDNSNVKSPLVTKGIVFNEMKGVFANPSSIVWRALMQHLYPNTSYGFDSGGLPRAITNLTYEELKAFHQKYYDKRQCNYFFYGDLPLKKHLKFLEETVFTEDLEKIAPISPIPKIERFKEPKSFTEKYHSSQPKKDPTYFALGFVTCDIEEQEEALALTLLDIILMDTDASLLKKKILDSKLCKDTFTYYDCDAKEMPYVIYCVGLEGKKEKLEQIIFSALEEICTDGIEEEWVKSALHQLEFSKLEISSAQGPYGLELMCRTVIPFQQGGKATDGVKIHSLLHALEEKIQDPTYLPSIIKKYFLENNHRVSFTLIPEKHVHEKEAKEEKKELEKIAKSLSPEEKMAMQEKITQFANYQKGGETENLECLPTLSINDIPKKVPYHPISRTMEKTSTIYHHDVFTNSIYYLDLVFDIPEIPEENLPYLRLFSSIIPELGTKKFPWEKNMQRIQQYFGSLGSGLALNVQKDNTSTCYPTLSIHSKFLRGNKKECFEVLKDTLLHIDLNDKERIKDLIIQIASSLESEVNRRALGYALKQSCAHISPWTHLGNLWYGAPYHTFIKELIQDLDKKLPDIIKIFTDFTKTLFHLNNAHVVISCEKKDFKELEEHRFYDLMNLCDATLPFHPWIELPIPTAPSNQGIIISSAIAHNALCLSTVTLTSELAPALKIATYLLENLFIHNMVREKGGAYGSGVKYNILTGVLHFYSSRDPHISSTINAFFTAVQLLADKEISERELTEAILSYIQDVDSPVTAGARASVTYFQEKVGLTKEVRQKFRDDILQLTTADIKRAIKETILPIIEKDSTQVSYAGEKMLKDANNSLGAPLTLGVL